MKTRRQTYRNDQNYSILLTALLRNSAHTETCKEFAKSVSKEKEKVSEYVAKALHMFASCMCSSISHCTLCTPYSFLVFSFSLSSDCCSGIVAGLQNYGSLT